MRFAMGSLFLAASAAAALPAHPQDPAAVLGIQRAAASKLEWEIREAGHPSLGNIRFAYLKRPVETQVGNSTVYSRAYFSCQRGRGMFAIELASATAPASPDGLQPAHLPRLTCHRHDGAQVVQEELLATWEVNEKLGDAITKGLRAFPLRECASIRVEQEVTLPAGWSRKTAKVEFDLVPYARELDAIFVTCGERSAYGPTVPAPAVAAAPATSAPPAATARVTPSTAMAPPATVSARLPSVPATPSPAPSQPARAAEPAPATQPAPTADSSWRSARAIPTGMTNLRAAPTLQSAIVVQLFPGAVVQVQHASADWWRARTKTPQGKVVEGYIREDRLNFK